MKRRKHVQRQLDKREDLRANALFYAAEGEKVAAFSVEFIATALALAVEVSTGRCKGKAQVIRELTAGVIQVADEAQLVLEPFRTRVCLDALDEWWALGEEGEDDDQDDPDDPSTAPVPAAFVAALSGS